MRRPRLEVDLGNDLLTEVKKIARKKRMTVSQVVYKLLQQAVTRHEAERKAGGKIIRLPRR